MAAGRFTFSPNGRARVLVPTIVGTLLCMAIALWVDSFNFASMDRSGLQRAIITDLLLPLCLAGPLLYFYTSKLRQLAIAHQELTVLASTDSLTSVLNRRAFMMMVEGFLAKVEAEKVGRGALLVVDADQFKNINDSFGHDSGDEALRIIAGTIKRQLRGADIVGRLGGEEFGVFLPNASLDSAETVAERIRGSIQDASFAPNGRAEHLSVSVGGVYFEDGLPFSDLFRIADQELYEAKHEGRNRVRLRHLGVPPITEAAPSPTLH